MTATNSKSETLNPKQIRNNKPYDLEQRTLEFARNCRNYVNRLPKNVQIIEDGKQLIRSSGSVAANYVEANESLSKKDFILRIRIAKKESRESILWLKLIGGESINIALVAEATELMKIFGAIVEKSK